MGFQGQSFDLTICIQNGISAFGIDQKDLFAEAVQVTRPAFLQLFGALLDGTPQVVRDPGRAWAHRRD